MFTYTLQRPAQPSTAEIETGIYDIVQSNGLRDLTEMQFKAQYSKIDSEILLQLVIKGLRPQFSLK